MNIQQLQAEVRSWTKWNFPNATVLQPLTGIGEEMGELADGLLSGHSEEIRDAVADAAIFAIHVAILREFDILWCRSKYPPNIDAVLEFGYPYPAFLRLVSSVGRLQHTILKSEQGIRQSDEEKIFQRFSDFWFQLDHIAAVLGFDFEHQLELTWMEVRKRDWIQYPQNGLSQ